MKQKLRCGVGTGVRRARLLVNTATSLSQPTVWNFFVLVWNAGPPCNRQVGAVQAFWLALRYSSYIFQQNGVESSFGIVIIVFMKRVHTSECTKLYGQHWPHSKFCRGKTNCVSHVFCLWRLALSTHTLSAKLLMDIRWLWQFMFWILCFRTLYILLHWYVLLCVALTKLFGMPCTEAF